MSAPAHRVGTLLVETQTGEVYAGCGLHIMVCEDHSIDPADVARCGFVTKGPHTVWEHRRPGEKLEV